MAHGMFLNSTFSISMRRLAVQIHFNKEESIFIRYGSWGVCFTYASWFALAGLAAAGKSYHNCLAIRRGVEFLLNLQTDDGGWGESYLSCQNEV